MIYRLPEIKLHTHPKKGLTIVDILLFWKNKEVTFRYKYMVNQIQNVQ